MLPEQMSDAWSTSTQTATHSTVVEAGDWESNKDCTKSNRWVMAQDTRKKWWHAARMSWGLNIWETRKKKHDGELSV